MTMLLPGDVQPDATAHETPATAPATARGKGRAASEEPVVQTSLLVLLVASMTILPYVVVSSDPDVWQMGATLSLLDFAAFAFALTAVGATVRRIRTRALVPVEWAGLAFLAALAATFAVHPSMRGLVLVARVLSCLVLSNHLRTTGDRVRGLVSKGIGISAIAQVVIAVGQRITRAPIGLGALGETLFPFRPGYPVPSGTMRDAYPLAGFGLFAAALVGVRTIRGEESPRFAAAVLAAGGILAGLSGSRAALITVVLVALGLVVAGARRGLPAAVVLVVAFAACAALSSPLWLRRTENPAAARSTSKTAAAHAPTTTDDVSNGRSALTRQALRLIAKHPVAGVGPGNYSTALAADPELRAMAPSAGLLPVHDLPLLAVAESGLLGVPGLVLVTGLTVLASLRRRGQWTAVLGAIVPYALLDLVFWFYPEGLVMLAVAIAFTQLDAAQPLAARRRHGSRRDRRAVAMR